MRLGLASWLAILAVAAALALPRAAEADHGDASNVGCFGSPYDPYLDPDPMTCIPAIARNLADGNVIDVCSPSFPASTEEAVKRWNDGLGANVFTYRDSGCARFPSAASVPDPGSDPGLPRLGSVIVTDNFPGAGPESTNPNLNCGGADTLACVIHFNIWGHSSNVSLKA